MTLFSNIAIEFGPIAAFVIAYAFTDFFTAITVTMVATATALVAALIGHGRLAPFPLVSTALVLSLGGLSLYFENETFFIFLDTLSNGLIGGALAISLFLRRPALELLFRHVFALTPRGWYYLTRRWAIFLLVIALGNEIVRLVGTPEQWVYFKTANLIFTVSFAFWQFRLAAREREPGAANALGLRITPLTDRNE